MPLAPAVPPRAVEALAVSMCARSGSGDNEMRVKPPSPGRRLRSILRGASKSLALGSEAGHERGRGASERGRAGQQAVWKVPSVPPEGATPPFLGDRPASYPREEEEWEWEWEWASHSWGPRQEQRRARRGASPDVVQEGGRERPEVEGSIRGHITPASPQL